MGQGPQKFQFDAKGQPVGVDPTFFVNKNDPQVTADDLNPSKGTPMDWARAGGSMALDAGGAAAQFLMPEEGIIQKILKGLTTGGAQGIKSLINGGSAKDALENGAFNGGLTAVAPTLGEQIPRQFTKAGLVTGGGLARGLKNQITPMTDAFMDIRKESPGWTGRQGDIGSGLRIGDTGKALKLQQQYGQKIENLENSVPGKPINLMDFHGSSDATANKLGSSTPVDDRNYYTGRDMEYAHQNSFQTNGVPPPGQTVDTNVTLRQNNVLKRERGKDAATLYKANQTPGPQPPRGDLLDERWNAAARDRHAELGAPVEEAAGIKPELDASNKMLSNLHKVNQANVALRGGGLTTSDITLLGTRGGTGAALGRIAGGMMGLDPFTGYAGGGILGLLASPSNMSNAGNALGRIASISPYALATQRLAEDARRLAGQNPPKKSRLRSPQ